MDKTDPSRMERSIESDVINRKPEYDLTRENPQGGANRHRHSGRAMQGKETPDEAKLPGLATDSILQEAMRQYMKRRLLF
ncbi:hypothetical protein [Burkholderia sp. IMCC1007]|uniref:hypothetical protein n=1 Tax=Burkholderia sp. IMCC1007 TaxID=3004104 RepID=UPI0022B388F6|nr:hypothetical protein [Burkholderia sp. IMCC1007]